LLHAQDPKDTSFNAGLIMHKQKPAIQVLIDGIAFLLPYDPGHALSSVNYSEELERLERVLQPKSPKKKHTAIPEFKLAAIDDSKVLASPWQRIAVEWLLAAEVQCKTTHGSALLEKVMPEFLFHTPKTERKRILLSIENKEKAADEQ